MAFIFERNKERERERQRAWESQQEAVKEGEGRWKKLINKFRLGSKTTV